MITPFTNFSGGNNNVEMLGSIESELDRLSQNYDVLAPLTIVKFGPLRVELTGSTYGSDPDGAAFPIPHGLGYAPIFQMYGYTPSNPPRLYAVPFLTTSGAGVPPANLYHTTQLSAYADDINVYAVWHGGAQQSTQYFYYIIYANPIVTN